MGMAAQLGGVGNATKHAGQTTKDAGKAVVHTTKKTASTAGTETEKGRRRVAPLGFRLGFPKPGYSSGSLSIRAIATARASLRYRCSSL